MKVCLLNYPLGKSFHSCRKNVRFAPHDHRVCTHNGAIPSKPYRFLHVKRINQMGKISKIRWKRNHFSCNRHVRQLFDLAPIGDSIAMANIAFASVHR